MGKRGDQLYRTLTCPHCKKIRTITYQAWRLRKSDLCQPCRLKLYPTWPKMREAKRTKAGSRMVKCDQCGKDMLRSKKKMEASIKHFCSDKCKRVAAKLIRPRHCRRCGKVQLKRLSDIKVSKTGLCKECQLEVKTILAAWKNTLCDWCGHPIKRVYCRHEGTTKTSRREHVYHFCDRPCKYAFFRMMYKSGEFRFGERIERPFNRAESFEGNR